RRPVFRFLIGNSSVGRSSPHPVHLFVSRATTTCEARTSAAGSRLASHAPSVGARSFTFRQPNCRAVRRKWQLAQRTSHLAISSSTSRHGLRIASSVTFPFFVEGSR